MGDNKEQKLNAEQGVEGAAEFTNSAAAVDTAATTAATDTAPATHGELKPETAANSDDSAVAAIEFPENTQSAPQPTFPATQSATSPAPQPAASSAQVPAGETTETKSPIVDLSPELPSAGDDPQIPEFLNTATRPFSVAEVAEAAGVGGAEVRPAAEETTADDAQAALESALQHAAELDFAAYATANEDTPQPATETNAAGDARDLEAAAVATAAGAESATAATAAVTAAGATVGSAAAAATVTISADHPMAALYSEVPIAPEKQGNRVAGLLISLVATLAFAVVYALVLLLFMLPHYTAAEIFEQGLLPYLVSPGFWGAALGFFCAMLLLVLVFGTAGWWAYVLGSFFVGALVWAASTFGFAFSPQLVGSDISYRALLRFDAETVAGLGKIAHSWAVIGAGLIAREVAVWFGAWIGYRGRKITAKNKAAFAEYEIALAEFEKPQN